MGDLQTFTYHLKGPNKTPADRKQLGKHNIKDLQDLYDERGKEKKNPISLKKGTWE